MVIASGVRDGVRQFLLLGLSAENIRRLTHDEPIRITPETHPGCPVDWEIVICFGQTEAAIAAELQRSGAVDQDTKTIAVARQPGRTQ